MDSVRTIDPILAAGLAGGYGTPIVRLKVYSNTTTLVQSVNVSKYQLTRFTCKVFTITNATVRQHYLYKLERGLEIAGIEYVVSSPWLYASRYSVQTHRQQQINQEVNFLTYLPASNYTGTTAANVSAATVIQNMMSVGCTAHFHTYETWHTWQYEKAGTNVKLFEISGFILQIWNKYTAKMFPRDDGYIFFRTAYSVEPYNTSGAGTAEEQLALGEIDGIISYNDDNTKYDYAWENMQNAGDPPNQWNLFWEDETGSTSRLSVTYAYLANRRLRNVGFLPSTASKAELLYVAYNPEEGLSKAETIMPLNLKPEQGELLVLKDAHYDSSLTLIANITESFNMPGTKYQWETKIDGEEMYYKRSQ
jgi:hypothetical protein